MFVFDVIVVYRNNKFNTQYRNKYTVIAADDSDARQKAVALFRKGEESTNEYSVLYCEIQHVRDIDE